MNWHILIQEKHIKSKFTTLLRSAASSVHWWRCWSIVKWPRDAEWEEMKAGSRDRESLNDRYGTQTYTICHSVFQVDINPKAERKKKPNIYGVDQGICFIKHLYNRILSHHLRNRKTSKQYRTLQSKGPKETLVISDHLIQHPQLKTKETPA